mgnify:CR=1 FL=1
MLVVDVPAETHVERLARDRGMSREDAEARIAAQATREQRLAIATHVIDNDGTLELFITAAHLSDSGVYDNDLSQNSLLVSGGRDIAAAADELTVSVLEIDRQVTQSNAVASKAVGEAERTNAAVKELDEAARRRLSDYLGLWDGDRPDALERAALASVARLAILPMQDILRLGSEAWLNLPGTVNGNWNWRMPAGCLTASLAGEYRELNALYGRS